MDTGLAARIQDFFLLYFVLVAALYLLLDALALFHIPRYMADHSLDEFPQIYSGLELPISVVAPAWNEEATIESSVRALLQLVYPEYEVVVVNDGSTDRTLETLVRTFSLVPVPEAYRVRLPVEPVRAVYRSTVHPNLRVIDKANGGKADAVNAGVNAARFPLVCIIDADSILQRNSLHRVAQPFLTRPETVAAGGTVRIANGCQVQDGFLVRPALPASFLARVQVIEYLRAFLFGRMGWSPMNALMVISGAFGLFHRETLIAAGGCKRGSMGEDMELTVRLHRKMRTEGRPYRITFVPDPICWTQAPEDLKSLRSQRIRWHHGLCETLWEHRSLLFHRRGGTVGWLAFPYLLLFEMLNPLVLAAGYLFTGVGLATGFVSLESALAFLALEIGLGILLSASALFLEEISFHIYPRTRDILHLLWMSVAENFGYRQVNAWWRLVALAQWLTGRKAAWTAIPRKSF